MIWIFTVFCTGRPVRHFWDLSSHLMMHYSVPPPWLLLCLTRSQQEFSLGFCARIQQTFKSQNAVLTLLMITLDNLHSSRPFFWRTVLSAFLRCYFFSYSNYSRSGKPEFNLVVSVMKTHGFALWLESQSELESKLDWGIFVLLFFIPKEGRSTS